MTTPTRLAGYLHVSLPAAPRALLLKVACPCGSWHTYDAGTVDAPTYRPGEVIGWVPDCRATEPDEVEIKTARFDPRLWSTVRGHLSATYWSIASDDGRSLR